MKNTVTLGIDTSNYTTSAAICDGGRIVENIRIPLPVKAGEAGLRQSDAVFHHIRNLPGLFLKLQTDMKTVDAIGSDIVPRDQKGSYMPCFLAGDSNARVLARSLGIPVFSYSHQANHIRAALYSSGDGIEGPFIAYHLSGGTFEALLCERNKRSYGVKKIGGTLDLTAGQLIDRVGVMLGLPFPCGGALEALALKNTEKLPAVKPSVKGSFCNLSGVQNKAMAFYSAGKSKEYVAAYTLAYIIATLDQMTEDIMEKHPFPLLFSGGVASNSAIKEYFSQKYGAKFAEPEFSQDNAAGAALLAYEELTGCM